MNVGTLVRLSAYGRKRRRAGWIEPDDVGIVVSIVDRTYGRVYNIRWCRSNYKKRKEASPFSVSWHWEPENQRKDLVFAK